MYGAIIGLIVGACFAYFGGLSWWWEFAWFFGGMVVELCARIGAGEELANAVGNSITAGIEFSSSGDGGGGDWGGDCGGCSGD